jgi:hypothetical protein
MTVLRLPLFREITALLLLLALMLQSATAVAPGPAWWGSQSVADPDALPDDFSAANIGQLKYLATKAAAALEAELPGGAGTAINALIATWNSPPASGVTRDAYLAVNQGQLKTVAALFYDRLGQPYPWAGSSAARDDYQLVNLGQLKHVFAFELKFRNPGSLTQIPAATLAAALAQWQALPVQPAGSSADDFDGDGIPNLQEYLMGTPLFDPLDIDGDRILDSVEDAHPGVLSKLRFADAVEDYDGDGVMNFEEVLLGLNLASATTSGRADGLGDSEVLAWSLAAGPTLTSNTDAVRALWEVIDADWIDREAGSYYLYWLLETLVNGVPAGLTSFRADVANWAWQPWNPGVWLIESPSLAHDPNWEPVDLDGNGVADFDRDNDNRPDLWEYRYSLNLRNGQDGNSDPDGDQLPNWQEYANGTNPRLADSDGDGFADKVELLQGGDPVQQSIAPPLTLQVVGSSYQAIYTGQTTPALAVKVTQGGLPVAGVSVAFALSAGAGRLKPASTAVGTPGSSLSQTTASNGIAAVTYESAAGEPEGTASISAGIAGASASKNFTVSIVEIPTAYGSAGGGDSTGGGNVGATNPTRVPTPPRSTAMSAAGIAAASADGYRIKVKRKFDTQSDYSKALSEYLSPYGLDLAALVGYGFQMNGWANHARLEFEALPLPPPPKRPVVPSGSRHYLVLVYEGENVATGPAGVPKYVGVLGFQYTEMGARSITLTGNVPDKFIKTDGSESVTFEPPKGSSAGERAWVSLLSVEIEVKRGGIGDNQDSSKATPTWRSQNGIIRDVVSLWDTDSFAGREGDEKADWLQVRVKLPLAIASSMPPNTIQWNILGQATPPSNTLETPKLSWPDSAGSSKQIRVTVAGKVFTVNVDIPEVGILDHASWAALMTITPGKGALGVANCWAANRIATSWSDSYSGKESLRNALRHSCWISYCASDLFCGPTFALLLGMAHEHNNKVSGTWPYESTMDLHNNYIGSTVVHPFDLTGDTIKGELLTKLASGTLWIWDSPGTEHTGFKATMKSNDAAIYPQP